MSMKNLTIIVVPLLIHFTIFSCSKNKQSVTLGNESITSNSRPDKYEWELVGSQGIVKFVYITDEGFSDEAFLSKLLGFLAEEKGNQILFFNNKMNTPQKYPMSDLEILHWKAKYANNLNSGYEEFFFLEIVDSTSSPPESEKIVANIRPKI